VAEEAPAARETDAGTVTALPAESVTTAPPLGAAPVSLTVPVAVRVEMIVIAFEVTEEIAAGLTVNDAVFVELNVVALIVTLASLATWFVVTENVAVFAPEAIVTDAGTCAATVLSDESVTTWPPEGAAAEIVTVPVDFTPPTTEVGLSVTPVNVVAAEAGRKTISDSKTAMTIPTRFIWSGASHISGFAVIRKPRSTRQWRGNSPFQFEISSPSVL
jgi:hypothetical protein